MELDPNKQYSLEETIKILTGVIEINYDNTGNDVSNPYDPLTVVESIDQINDNGSMSRTDENGEKEKDDQNEKNLNIFSTNEIEAICKRQNLMIW